MEYPLCDQTVTVYRSGLRLVIHGCYLEISQGQEPEDRCPQWEFLLVVPGACQRVFPGDRLVPGQGPETITAAEHPLVVSQVKRFFLDGQLTHIEAR